MSSFLNTKASAPLSRASSSLVAIMVESAAPQSADCVEPSRLSTVPKPKARRRTRSKRVKPASKAPVPNGPQWRLHCVEIPTEKRVFTRPPGDLTPGNIRIEQPVTLVSTGTQTEAQGVDVATQTEPPVTPGRGIDPNNNDFTKYDAYVDEDLGHIKVRSKVVANLRNLF